MKNKVIVVGAGPAGCSAAITTKKLLPELAVELYEQRPQIGKSECGEAISHNVIEENREVLKNVLKGCIARDFNKFIVKMNGNEKNIDAHGHMIHRPKFNKNLVKEAKSVGCKVRLGCIVKPVKRIDDLWKVNIENRFSHKSSTEECDVMILAGGGSSRMAVDAGLITEGQHKKWMREHVFGFQYKIESLYKEEALLVDFTPNPDPDTVYHYAFLHHGNVGNFGSLNKHKFVASSFYKRLLMEYLKKMGVKKSKIMGRLRGNYIPGGGPIPKTFGNGVMVVGDNAGFTNPIYFSGTLMALSSGRIAGNVIAEAYEVGNFEEATLGKYEKEWRSTPWGDPILMEGKIIHEKLRTGMSISPREKEIYDNVLDITKNHCW